jgi:hypothetical protein
VGPELLSLAAVVKACAELHLLVLRAAKIHGL